MTIIDAVELFESARDETSRRDLAMDWIREQLRAAGWEKPLTQTQISALILARRSQDERDHERLYRETSDFVRQRCESLGIPTSHERVLTEIYPDEKYSLKHWRPLTATVEEILESGAKKRFALTDP